MGSTLIISRSDNPDEKSLWMPSSYNFRTTLQHIIDVLKTSHPDMAQDLEKYRDRYYMDISQWNAKQLNTFFYGVVRAEQRLNDQWATQLTKPNLGLSVMQSLKIRLYFDHRISDANNHSEYGTIIVGSNQIWQQMKWVYDFTLTVILERIVRLMFDKKILRNQKVIMPISKAQNGNQLDMTALSNEEHKILVAGIDLLNSAYNVHTTGYGSSFPEQAKSIMQPAITQLYSMYAKEYPDILLYWETGEE